MEKICHDSGRRETQKIDNHMVRNRGLLEHTLAATSIGL